MLLVVAALVAGWLVRSMRSPATRAAGDEPPTGPRAEGVELLSPEHVQPAPIDPVQDAASARRESRQESVPRGILRGRLVLAEDRVSLAVERIVLLASAGNTVAETLRSRADGSFTSARAFPRGVVRAWVKHPEDGALLARHEAQFDPERAGEWLVPVPEPDVPAVTRRPEPVEATRVLGRVADLAGRPVAGALVKAYPRGVPGTIAYGTTDGAGEFELPAKPGAQLLIAQGRFTRSAALELAVVEGANDAGVILLPAGPPAGDVLGRLVAEDGDEDPLAVLVLRELASGRELATACEWQLFSSAEDGRSPFSFQDVPPGEYELEVVAIDGRSYEPERVRVSPPATGLEFHARGAPAEEVELDVRDALTGEALGSFVALGRIRGEWVADLDNLSRVVERWVVCAEGYRPAQGDWTDAQVVRAGEGEPTLEIALHRGHGAALLCKDLESDRLVVPEAEGWLTPGLAGVRALAGGRELARSDASGLLVIESDADPGRLELVRPGWRVVEDRVDEGLRSVFLARE